LKDAGEIDLKDMLPVFEGDFFSGGTEDGSGVVDEDIDAAEPIFDLGEEIFGAGGGGEIGVKGCGVIADSCGGFGGGAAVAVTGDDGSCLRKRDGDGCAEAACGAGDESYFVVEAEAFEDVEGFRGHLGQFTGIRVEEQTEEMLTMKRRFRIVGYCLRRQLYAMDEDNGCLRDRGTDVIRRVVSDDDASSSYAGAGRIGESADTD
jgi:hypothetical protein